MLERTIYVFIAKFVGAVFALLFHIYVSRMLSVNLVGEFFTFLSTVYIFSCFSRLGTDQLAVKYVSIAYNNRSMSNVFNIGKKLYTTLLIGSLIVFVIIFLINKQTIWILNIQGDQLKYAKYVIPFFSLFFLNTEILKSLNRPVLSQFLQNASIPLLFIFFHAVLLMNYTFNIYAVYLTTVFIASAILIFLLIKFILAMDQAACKQIKSEYFSLPFFSISLSIIIFNWGGVFLLGLFSGSENVAWFNAINRIAIISSFLSSAINSVFAPKFSILSSKDDVVSLKKSLKESLKISIPSSLLFFGIIVLFSKKIIVMFGTQYGTTTDSLIILSLGYSLNAALGSIGTCLMMCGWASVVQKISWFSVGLFIFLVLVVAAYRITEFEMSIILLFVFIVKSIALMSMTAIFFRSR